jgi:phosphohistidine phosphatase
MIDIILIRHAKAVGGAGMEDRDRPLSERGARDAAAMASYIAARLPRPQRLHCSAAVRTRETAAPLLDVWALDSEQVSYDGSLYLATAEAILEVLRYASGNGRSLCLIGHNPGISEAVDQLAAEGFQDELPTFGVAWLQADVDRPEDLADRSCRLVDVLTPKKNLRNRS